SGERGVRGTVDAWWNARYTGAVRSAPVSAEPTDTTWPAAATRVGSSMSTAAPSWTWARSRSNTSATTHSELGLPISISGSPPGWATAPTVAWRAITVPSIGARSTTVGPAPPPRIATVVWARASSASLWRRCACAVTRSLSTPTPDLAIASWRADSWTAASCSAVAAASWARAAAASGDEIVTSGSPALTRSPVLTWIAVTRPVIGRLTCDTAPSRNAIRAGASTTGDAAPSATFSVTTYGRDSLASRTVPSGRGVDVGGENETVSPAAGEQAATHTRSEHRIACTQRRAPRPMPAGRRGTATGPAASSLFNASQDRHFRLTRGRW